MSRGGRGRGATGMSALASALGIQRHEMGAYNSGTADARTAIYPPLPVRPVPVTAINDDLEYTVEAENALLRRYRAAPTFITARKSGISLDGIRRYTDKYRTSDRVRFTPDNERLPRELHPSKGAAGPAAKKRRLDQADVLKKLDARMSSERHAASLAADGVDPDAAPQPVDGADADERPDGEKQGVEEAEQAAVSDDDYFEEDNDYVENYFDNGENYGESDSGDNLDDDAVI